MNLDLNMTLEAFSLAEGPSQMVMDTKRYLEIHLRTPHLS